jgi:hypothetical protein
MASPARHLSLLAFVALLAAWGGARFFFSKTTRPEAAVDAPEKALVATTTAVPTDAANPNSVTEVKRGIFKYLSPLIFYVNFNYLFY